MSIPIYLVTVCCTPSRSKGLMETITKEFKSKYNLNLVHIANCADVAVVESVLPSLTMAPRIMIIMGDCFDERDEIREVAQRNLPKMPVIVIPIGLLDEKVEGIIGFFEEEIMETQIIKLSEFSNALLL